MPRMLSISGIATRKFTKTHLVYKELNVMRNYTTQTKQIIILVYLKTCFLAQRRTKRGKWALCQKSAFLKLISYNKILYSWNTVSTEMEFLDIIKRLWCSLLHAIHSPSYWRILQKTKCYPEKEFLDINFKLLTEDSFLLLHAIQSPFYWRFLQKTKNYSV